MKVGSAALALTAIILTGCSGQALDFRNAEISNSRIYDGSSDKPFSGTVTNVPISRIRTPDIGELLKFVGDATHDRSHSSLMLGAALGQIMGGNSPALCDVDVEDGYLDGTAVCSVAGSASTRVFEFHYANNVPTGDIRLFSPKQGGKLLAEAALDSNGKLSGESTIYYPQSGKPAGRATWVDGKAAGAIEAYDAETGNVILKGTTENGVMVGEEVRYAPDGKTVIKRANYIAGRLNGPYEEYDQSGKLLKKTIYEAGVDVKERDRLEAAYLSEAKELVAAGVYPGSDIEQVVVEVRSSRECLAKAVANSGNATPSEYVIEGCRVWTPERIAEMQEMIAKYGVQSEVGSQEAGAKEEAGGALDSGASSAE